MATAAAHDADRSNAEFWDELCGSVLARSIGITDASPESLARFDGAYFDFYPYLESYLPDDTAGKRVLEVGLGYGTVGGWLAARGADYRGLDIARGPVEMMRSRLGHLGVEGAPSRADQGSLLDLPFGAGEFDHVVSIGCVHHTGDVPRALAEIHRVLVPGGRALVMVYNARSARRIGFEVRRRLRRTGDAAELRARYDANESGEAAPVTEFLSRGELGRLLAPFSDVSICVENFDELLLARGHVRLRRGLFLRNLAHVVGLDLYAVAVK